MFWARQNYEGGTKEPPPRDPSRRHAMNHSWPQDGLCCPNAHVGSTLRRVVHQCVRFSIDISLHEINAMQPHIRGHEVEYHNIRHRAYRISHYCRDNVFHTKRQMIDGNTFVILTLRDTGFLPTRTLNVPNTHLLWVFSDTVICWGVKYAHSW